MARSATRVITASSEKTPGLTPRKRGAERWEEILQAAVDIFYEKGYDSASLQDIADRVGILKGSIYYYIETKSDLRNNLLVEVHTLGLEMIQRLAETEGDALKKLEAMIRGHVTFICGNLPKTTIYLQELKKLPLDERARLLDPTQYRNVFLEVLRQGQREGVILPDLNPKLAAQSMMASLNSLIQWYKPSRGRPSKVIADHFVTTLLRGHATKEGLKRL